MNSMLENTLKNQFDLTQIDGPFVDLHSQMALSVSREFIGINGVFPRGLGILRTTLTQPSLRMLLRFGPDAMDWPVSVKETTTFPWGCRQKGQVAADNGPVDVESVLVCPCFNTYVMEIRLRPQKIEDPPKKQPVSLAFDGQFVECFTKMVQKEQAGSILFYAQQDSPYGTWPGPDLQDQDFLPCWRVSLKEQDGQERLLQLSRSGQLYKIDAGTLSLQRETTIRIVLDMENRPQSLCETWPKPVDDYDVEKIWRQSQVRWTQLLEPIAKQQSPTLTRRLRAACVLDRCGYQGKHGRWGPHVGSMCMVSSWASTAFFWDSVFGAIGLNEFDCKQAEDALRVLFAFQRPDGCVPTHAYEQMVGSTYYPQAPIASWAVLRMYRKHQNIAFVREILPKLRVMFDWNTHTQDHDHDGLIEVRFTGQMSDNAPQYDRYISAVSPRPECWNIYLPPVASVVLNSFHYMDGRSLEALYTLTDQHEEAKAVRKIIDAIPKKMLAHCWDEKTNYFHDFDHQIGQFNRARVLTGTFPLWAGMPLDEKIKRTLIEENILAREHFWGEYPLPYLAYSDPRYKPTGYWRGRVWPHTTTWILEMLWQNGYQKQADEAARKLLTMMNQQEYILENYNSDPTCPGGGSADYQWASAAYLFIINERYKENIW